MAAIFKIVNSKDIPEIPSHLSREGKDFLRLCLQRDPSARPTAAQLMDHPFVRDQATAKFGGTNLARELPHSPSDGTQTPPVSHSLEPGKKRARRFPFLAWNFLFWVMEKMGFWAGGGALLSEKRVAAEREGLPAAAHAGELPCDEEPQVRTVAGFFFSFPPLQGEVDFGPGLGG